MRMIFDLVALGGMSLASFQMFRFVAWDRSTTKTLNKTIKQYKEG